jgi:predicted DNA repair protein MutK
MSGGLFALLDDISVLARAAAASVDDVAAASGRASVKAAGVVVDDTAVTPRYVEGLDPKRELPIIKRITIGSLRNKLVFIVPAILLLNAFLPWALSPLLMLGGTYLCFEGAEKIWEKVSGHGHHAGDEEQVGDEDAIVKGAVTTDFILSAEIMVISLKAVLDEGLDDSFWYLLAVMVVVAIVITLVVYGTVGLIVKMDDIGLALSKRESGLSQTIGQGLVTGMPKLLTVLSVVGVAAMLWVGGHIILVGLEETGWLPQPYEFVHHLEEQVHHATGALGGVLGWLTNTVASAILGLVVGAIVVAVMHVLPFGKDEGEGAGAH